MTTTALVMAGGKGTRLTLKEEKPLLQVGGKPVIVRVLEALRNAKKIDSVVVAVTDFTPRTAAFVASLGVEVIVTPGKEYVWDMDFAVKMLGLETVLAVGADLPLLTGEIVDDILAHYAVCGKPALAVAVPLEMRQKLDLGVGYAFDCQGKRVVYAGINVLDGSKIDDAELEQEVYVLDKVEVAVNINTVDELLVAQKQFAKVFGQKS
jgi:adenosylcobinamide-phosphate guanylyltransferase